MASVVVDNPAALTGAAARALFRDGLVSPTAGWARGFSQANLVAVPADAAYDVLLFSQRNPKPCPLLDVTDAGAMSTRLAPSADLRTDLPLYHVWRMANSPRSHPARSMYGATIWSRFWSAAASLSRRPWSTPAYRCGT